MAHTLTRVGKTRVVVILQYLVIQASMKKKNNFQKTLDHVSLICGISKQQAIIS